MLGILRRLGHPMIAVTGRRDSSLGRFADVALATGKLEEACPLRLAPTCSTTAMLALGDALALSVMQQRNFTADDFAVFHPAGQLGRKLMKVGEAMTFRLGENLPTARATQSVGDTLREVSKISRRPGAVVVVDDDGDARRHFQRRRPAPPHRRPRRHRDVAHGRRRDDPLAQARPPPTPWRPTRWPLMRRHRIDELPVVDAGGRVVGLIDVQDLVVLKLFDVDDAAADAGA